MAESVSLILSKPGKRVKIGHFLACIYVLCFLTVDHSPFSHNDFVAILDLPEGEHQYKFFVDGQWVHDPSEVIPFSSICLHSDG